MIKSTVFKNDLDTPCLVLDIELFEQNLHTMRDHAMSAGKKLRPHAKTHKCSEMARRQLKSGNCAGICVAKVSEAWVLAQSGIKDILITSPVTTVKKIEKMFDCATLCDSLIVVVDNFNHVDFLNAEAARRKNILKVLVDIDPEMGRTGVDFASALELGKYITGQSNLKLKGIQCYAGQVQHISGFEERRDTSLQLMRHAAKVFNQFKESGLGCDIFTGTGTGTFDIDCEIPEMTDLQVGSYCVMDSEYFQLGSRGNPNRFEAFQPALTILSSVISVNQDNFVTIDAGLKAIYYTPEAPPLTINPPSQQGWKYDWFGDEFGRINIPAGQTKPALGAIIELCASHCDPTINLFDSIYVVRKNEVIDCWAIDLRGRCQ